MTCGYSFILMQKPSCSTFLYSLSTFPKKFCISHCCQSRVPISPHTSTEDCCLSEEPLPWVCGSAALQSDCISLMTNSVHALICLPDICIHLKWNTFVFSPCFKSQLFILLLSCRSSWYIMCTKEQKPLLDTLSENIFSQPVVFFFSFLMAFFEAQNL